LAAPEVLPARRRLQTRSGALQFALSERARDPGDPAIVLFNGAGMTLEGWAPLYPAIEALGPVFAWDRFGVEGSDAPQRPPSGSVVLASLRELLAYADVAPPYVLVGHSLGGLHANLFARLHPQEVAGVLLIEATHPLDAEALRGHQDQHARALSKLLSLPQERFRSNLEAELACIDETVAQLEAAGSFPEVPLAVVTGGQAPPVTLLSPAAAGARRAHQQELARLSATGEQVIAQRSGHFPQLSEPGLVLEVLERLMVRSRRHGADVFSRA
jgi:pimeloyl-ACP methyl ester carboxylesterase